MAGKTSKRQRRAKDSNSCRQKHGGNSGGQQALDLLSEELRQQAETCVAWVPFPPPPLRALAVAVPRTLSHALATLYLPLAANCHNEQLSALGGCHGMHFGPTALVLRCARVNARFMVMLSVVKCHRLRPVHCILCLPAWLALGAGCRQLHRLASAAEWRCAHFIQYLTQI